MTLQVLIFADFNNLDRYGRIRLNLIGTINDLKANDIKLEQGIKLRFTDHDEFETLGIVEYSEDEKIWVARID